MGRQQSVSGARGEFGLKEIQALRLLKLPTERGKIPFLLLKAVENVFEKTVRLVFKVLCQIALLFRGQQRRAGERGLAAELTDFNRQPLKLLLSAIRRRQRPSGIVQEQRPELFEFSPYKDA